MVLKILRAVIFDHCATAHKCAVSSDVPTGGLGAIAPHFYQDGAQDFIKIDEKVGVVKG